MSDYKQIAKDTRLVVARMIQKAQTSHLGSCFSAADLLTVLFERMDTETDEFIASKGWCAALVYALLARKGVIPRSHLRRFCAPNETEYIGLIEPRGKFGLRFAGGSMGMGIAAGVGFALARKWAGLPGHVYVLASDGEMNCGTTWEAAALAAHHKLDNLVVIVDRNGLQAMGSTREVLEMDLEGIWSSFGWQTLEMNGHDYECIEKGLRIAEAETRPTVLLANTVKCKGWPREEGKNLYHYWHVTKKDYAEIKKALEG